MKIKDVCTMNPKDDAATLQGQVSFVPMQKISNDGCIDTSDIRNAADVCKGFTAFADGDILMAKITPCMENGKGAIARDLHNGRGFGSTEFFVLRPDYEKVTSEWLYYFTTNKSFRIDCEKNMTGSAGQKRVPKSYIENYEIPVPPLTIQRKACTTLQTVGKLIRKHKEQINALDELVKSRFIELFGDPVANTFGWRQESLREVTSKIGSGATPRGGKESYQAEGVTLIRSMNVYDGRFEYKDLAHITDNQAAQLDNVTVEKGDVFINITGASVARSCIVPDNTLPARVNQHVAIIRCVHSKLLPVFANNMFLNSNFKEQLLSIGESGGATRQAITKQQLENLTVILPPIGLQQQFVAFVVQVDKSKESVKKSLQELETLKSSLMQRYFG